VTTRVTKKTSKKPSVAGASGTRAMGASSRRRSTALAPNADTKFAEVVALIEAARNRAYQAVNAELVSLYWQLGEHISTKIANAEWGDKCVELYRKQCKKGGEEVIRKAYGSEGTSEQERFERFTGVTPTEPATAAAN
jgi:hypothetical protein